MNAGVGVGRGVAVGLGAEVGEVVGMGTEVEVGNGFCAGIGRGVRVGVGSGTGDGAGAFVAVGGMVDVGRAATVASGVNVTSSVGMAVGTGVGGWFSTGGRIVGSKLGVGAAAEEQAVNTKNMSATSANRRLFNCGYLGSCVFIPPPDHRTEIQIRSPWGITNIFSLNCGSKLPPRS